MQAHINQNQMTGWIRRLAVITVFVLAAVFAFAGRAEGAELTPSFSSTDGSNGEKILDDSNYTMEPSHYVQVPKAVSEKLMAVSGRRF